MYLAYLDPGSGSMLAAAVVAGFAGAAVAVRVWWRRLKNKLLRRPAGAAGTGAGTPGAANEAAQAESERAESAQAEQDGAAGASSDGSDHASEPTKGKASTKTGVGATPVNTSADSDRER